MRRGHLRSILLVAVIGFLAPRAVAAQVGPEERVRLVLPGDTVPLAPLSWVVRVSIDGQAKTQHADYRPSFDTLDIEPGATVEFLFTSRPDTAWFGWDLSDPVFTSPPYVWPTGIEPGEVLPVRGCGVWWERLDPAWDRPARIARCWQGALQGRE